MTDLHDPPDWVADAIVYQVFPDRFCRGHDPRPGFAALPGLDPWDAPPALHGYKGGNLFGIIERLPYLRDLGVTALYLNPIFSATAYHRYHTHDFLSIDPLLGDLTTFRALLDQAHAAGLRVILDGVFNHCGRTFLQFADVMENGPRSPWADWFRIDGWPIHPYDETRPANYAGWAGYRALPIFNHRNPAVRDYLLGVAAYWTGLGIDGWRLDAPEGVNCPTFWPAFRETVRGINPDAWLVGELIDFTDPWRPGQTFDGITNYPLWGATVNFVGRHHLDLSKVHPMHHAARRPLTGAGFLERVAASLAACPPATTRSHLTFLDNHDNARFSTLMREDPRLTELGIVLLFALPGAPCIYYGSEVGLPGGLDPDCRRGFPAQGAWDRDRLALYKRLIGLRTRHRALCRGDFTPLAATDDGVAFMRSLDGENILVAVNCGDRREAFAVDCTATPAGATLASSDPTHAGALLHGHGQLTRLAAAAGAQLRIELAPRSALVVAL